jgi:alpha-glucosidase
MEAKLNWWQTESIYQVYIKSFYDSNNDGVGDFAGVGAKLDYIKSLGANIVWITPCYPSDGKDGGYDITSFTEVDPVYGSMADFDNLVRLVHEKNMYILLDFVPNHTSDQHVWFKQSSANNHPSNPYRDYYVWFESEDSVNPPNNWVCLTFSFF